MRARLTHLCHRYDIECLRFLVDRAQRERTDPLYSLLIDLFISSFHSWPTYIYLQTCTDTNKNTHIKLQHRRRNRRTSRKVKPLLVGWIINHGAENSWGRASVRVYVIVAVNYLKEHVEAARGKRPPINLSRFVSSLFAPDPVSILSPRIKFDFYFYI